MIYFTVALGTFLLSTLLVFSLPIVPAVGRLMRRIVLGWYLHFLGLGQRIASKIDGQHDGKSDAERWLNNE